MGNEIIVTTDSRPYKSLITDIGNAKMTRAVLDGRKVNVVEMRLGDGGGSYYLPTPANTALVNEVWTGEIAAKTINPATPNIISIKAVIPPSVGGFTIREAALFDDEGDMIAVCNMPEIAKATLPDGISSSLDVVMNILLSNVDAVEFIINPTLDPASRDDLALAVAELREEMDDLAASVLANDAAAPLETTSGDTIIARDGAELFAWQRRRENEPAGDMCASKDETSLLFRLVDDMRADFKRSIQALTNAIMSGSLTAPLTGRTGAAITTRDSADISAVKYL